MIVMIFIYIRFNPCIMAVAKKKNKKSEPKIEKRAQIISLVTPDMCVFVLAVLCVIRLCLSCVLFYPLRVTSSIVILVFLFFVRLIIVDAACRIWCSLLLSEIHRVCVIAIGLCVRAMSASSYDYQSQYLLGRCFSQKSHFTTEDTLQPSTTGIKSQERRTTTNGYNNDDTTKHHINIIIIIPFVYSFGSVDSLSARAKPKKKYIISISLFCHIVV